MKINHLIHKNYLEIVKAGLTIFSLRRRKFIIICFMVIFIKFRAFDILQMLGITFHLHYDSPISEETIRIMLFDALLSR